MTIEQLTEARTQLALEQWPHISQAWGCENCGLLFAQPINHHCPGCGSQSVFDASVLLNAERIPAAELVAAASGMIERIDGACSDAREEVTSADAHRDGRS